VALRKEGVGFSLPQVDCLFDYVDSEKEGVIDAEKWEARVFDDRKNHGLIEFLDMNPLQYLRDVVNRHELTGEDLLHKMKKRIIDEPLSFPEFTTCLLKLDS